MHCAKVGYPVIALVSLKNKNMGIKSRRNRATLAYCIFFVSISRRIVYCFTLQVSANSVAPTSYIYEKGMCIEIIEKMSE